MSGLSRRAFFALGGSAAAAAAIAVTSLKAAVRPPYVRVGESVSYIGLGRHPEPTFIGSTHVVEIGEWDGVGYPCRLHDQGYSTPPRTMEASFYDSDLSNFLVDVPMPFWSDPFRASRYPNVHAYVREKRFGEHPDVMRRVQARVRAQQALWA